MATLIEQKIAAKHSVITWAAGAAEKTATVEDPATGSLRTSTPTRGAKCRLEETLVAPEEVCSDGDTAVGAELLLDTEATMQCCGF